MEGRRCVNSKEYENIQASGVVQVLMFRTLILQVIFIIIINSILNQTSFGVGVGETLGVCQNNMNN